MVVCIQPAIQRDRDHKSDLFLTDLMDFQFSADELQRFLQGFEAVFEAKHHQGVRRRLAQKLHCLGRFRLSSALPLGVVI